MPGKTAGRRRIGGNILLDEFQCLFDLIGLNSAGVRSNTFSNGATVTAGGVNFAINYNGGALNQDVVITTQAPTLSSRPGDVTRLLRISRMPS